MSLFKKREAGFIDRIKRAVDIGAGDIAVEIITTLLARDFTYGTSLPNYYGGGYELLLVDNGKISKQDDITYVFWRTQFTEEGDIKFPIPLQLHSYKYINDLLFIRALRIGQTAEGGRVANSQVYFIPPVNRNVSEDEIAVLSNSEAKFIYDHTYLSKNFFHLFLIEDDNHIIRGWLHFHQKYATIELVMTEDKKGIFINYDISWLYKVREHVRLNPYNKNFFNRTEV